MQSCRIAGAHIKIGDKKLLRTEWKRNLKNEAGIKSEHVLIVCMDESIMTIEDSPSQEMIKKFSLDKLGHFVKLFYKVNDQRETFFVMFVHFDTEEEMLLFRLLYDTGKKTHEFLIASLDDDGI